MADSGTGTDPSTDRCPDCGHLWERPCGCSCCGLPCETYCSHGGVCELPTGHDGRHNSGYCQWSDAESVDRDEANRRLAGKPGGAAFLAIWESEVPRRGV